MAYSIRFLQFLKVVLILLFSAFGITIIYSLIQPDAFGNVVIERGFNAGFGIGAYKICPACSKENLLTLQSLSSSMKIWLLLRGGLFFIICLFMFQRIGKILSSVQSNATFYEGNIQNFKTLSSYGWILAILSSFNFFIQGEVSHLDFSIPFGTIAFALACAALANVFREGKDLTDDRNSIV